MNLRDVLLGPASTNKRASPWQPTFPFTYGQLGRSYQEIDPTIGETALQSVAYRSGVDLIASIVSELPLVVYSGEGSQRRQRNTPGYLEDPAGDGHGREDWMYQWLTSWFLRGNAFGNIVDQGPTGMIRQVDIFHPDTISVSVMEGREEWHASGVPIPNSRMLHKRVNPVPGTLMGLSAVQAHASTLGLSLATTSFGRTWFQDGGHPGGILTNSESDMGDSGAIQKVKDRFMAALFGAREPIVLGRGWKYETIQVSPEESQFLGTQGWTEAQCARILGPGVAEVLGYESGSSMTYGNMVDRDIAMLKYAVGKWVKRMERVFFGWLPQPQYAILDKDAFLETSAMQRWQLNRIKLETGAATINEIREKEYQGPVEWGKEPFAIKAAASEDPDQPGAPNTETPQRGRIRVRGFNPDQPRDPDGKFGSGGGSGGGPGTGTDIHATFDFDALSAPDGDTVFGGTDTIQNALAAERGFTGKPELGSKEDVDAAIADGGTELHRGFSRAEHAEQFKNGDYFASPGASGAGIYCTDDGTISDDFASKGEGTALRMALKPGAKVATFKQISKKMDQLDDDGDLHPLLLEDEGRAATALGYDAYHKKYHDGGEVWVVLNRTALIVEDSK